MEYTLPTQGSCSFGKVRKVSHLLITLYCHWVTVKLFYSERILLSCTSALAMVASPLCLTLLNTVSYEDIYNKLIFNYPLPMSGFSGIMQV